MCRNINKSSEAIDPREVNRPSQSQQSNSYAQGVIAAPHLRTAASPLRLNQSVQWTVEAPQERTSSSGLLDFLTNPLIFSQEDPDLRLLPSEPKTALPENNFLKELPCSEESRPLEEPVPSTQTEESYFDVLASWFSTQENEIAEDPILFNQGGPDLGFLPSEPKAALPKNDFLKELPCSEESRPLEEPVPSTQTEESYFDVLASWFSTTESSSLPQENEEVEHPLVKETVVVACQVQRRENDAPELENNKRKWLNYTDELKIEICKAFIETKLPNTRKVREKWCKDPSNKYRACASSLYTWLQKYGPDIRFEQYIASKKNTSKLERT